MVDDAKGEAPNILSIPVYHVGAVHLLSTGNDVMFNFTSLQPTLGNEGVMAPTVAISMSRGAATDFLQVFAGIMDALEQDLGKIDTPFLKERREPKK
jgi:hypothetical protein